MPGLGDLPVAIHGAAEVGSVFGEEGEDGVLVLGGVDQYQFDGRIGDGLGHALDSGEFLAAGHAPAGPEVREYPVVKGARLEWFFVEIEGSGDDSGSRVRTFR